MVLGCIDGFYVPIVASIEILFTPIQAICDNNLKFIDVVAKWPGSTHDTLIWRQSVINQKISLGEMPNIKV